MTATLITLAALWLTMLAAQDTPIGRGIRRWSVEAPARWLGRFTRGQAITLLLFVLFLGGLALMLEEEGLRLAAMYAPELIGILASVEFTAAVDALAVVVATFAAGRAAMLRDWLKARIGTGMQRARRTRRVRRNLPPSNDDEPAALPLAA